MSSRFIPLSIAVSGLAAAAGLAAPSIGQPAPAFTATDATGRTVRLADYRGRTVVLEWTNSGCPFVQKHYASGNMQKTQAAAGRDGVVWLTVNSGAPGKQGHVTGPQAIAWAKQAGARPAAYLLDPAGRLGRSYEAKTTPQIAIVDAKGALVYQGGIDDKPTADPGDIAAARNHVLAALGEIKSGKPVSVPQTRPYGCSVKYGG